jgi:hypothetical protein
VRVGANVYVMIRDAFLAVAGTAAALLREPAVSARWSEKSALADFSVAGLARHLANQVTRTQTLLTAPAARSARPILEHYTRNAWVTSGPDGPDNVRIRRQGEEAAAGTTPQALADEVDAALAELRRRLPAEPGERVVDLGEWGLTVDDFLVTRVMGEGRQACPTQRSCSRPTPVISCGGPVVRSRWPSRAAIASSSAA